MAMRTFDFSPLYRSTVGFDSVTRLLESALRADEGQNSYPPYNIEKTGENAYRITMAVAGFSESDITITAQDNSLVVTGKIAKTEEEKKFLHRGIAGRAFERRFELAEHIRVSGASLVNGLLHVDLVKEVPEAKKPRTVKIETVAPKQATVLENQAA
ncbi:heat-shock protein Hsp20 [Hypericibacter terrae]|jgi:molecular chaperone IbpA|uniref:Heat-shock protein Hsp20 n=2 Tax=Hypericibacter terrae TaxID=2602015 RepID=A0A5J6MN95_9PROT|nr:heat-shock protein Hsp20 [Hypericibacter terrae]